MKNILLTLLATCFLISCSNDDATGDPENENNFYALNLGNSWVYKVYNYDNETETYIDSGIMDSVSVVSKVDIEGDTYYKVRSFITGNKGSSRIFPNGERFELLRDSLGYLINNEGFIKYSNTNFNERVSESYGWGTIYHKLTEQKANISVNAGVFESLDMEVYATLPPPEDRRLEGTDHYYFAEGVGYVIQTYSSVTSTTPFAEKRLESFIIN